MLPYLYFLTKSFFGKLQRHIACLLSPLTIQSIRTFTLAFLENIYVGGPCDRIVCWPGLGGEQTETINIIYWHFTALYNIHMEENVDADIEKVVTAATK
jgi:hypothetical protein